MSHTLTGYECGSFELLEYVLLDHNQVTILVLLISASVFLTLLQQLLHHSWMQCGKDIPEELPRWITALILSWHVLAHILELHQHLRVYLGQ